MVLGGDDTVGDLLLKAGPGAEVKVRQAGSGKGRIRVAEVVVADTVVGRDLLGDSPRVFDEAAARCLRIAVVVGLRLACQRIVGEIAFGVGIVIDEVDQAVELEVGLCVGACKERDIVSVPALVARPNRVRSLNVREDVAPVIAVLDIVSQSEAIAKTNPKAAHANYGNGEVAA